MKSWMLTLLFAGICLTAGAQNELVCEKIYRRLSALATALPANIQQAHQRYDGLRNRQNDSLQQLLSQAFVALAKQVQGRSAVLNSLSGADNGEGTRYLLPASPEMANFFMQQHERMDALEQALSRQLKPFNQSETYKKQGYLNTWDSVYRMRRPALQRYYNGVLKLVSADIAYLKANRKLAASEYEAERIQYAEAEAKVLQRLIYLKDRWYRIVVEDGAEKVAYCNAHPGTCRINNQNKRTDAYRMTLAGDFLQWTCNGVMPATDSTTRKWNSPFVERGCLMQSTGATFS